MSVGDAIFGIIATAILSPMVCFVVYLVWKGQREVKQIMRRNEVVESIQKDYMTQRAIIGLVTEKMKDDYLFQKAIVTLVIEQLQKDWKLEKAVISIAKKA